MQLKRLTLEKKKLAQRGYCPDCETKTLMPGPKGGLCQNFDCSTCNAKFNIGPVTVERIVE